MFADEACLQELLVVAVSAHWLGLDGVGCALAELEPALGALEAVPVVVLLPEPESLPQDHAPARRALLAELLHVAALAVVLPVLAPVHAVQLGGAGETGETLLMEFFAVDNQFNVCNISLT